jgi:hypothetical protein
MMPSAVRRPRVTVLTPWPGRFVVPAPARARPLAGGGLDCPAARRAIDRGGVSHCAFFAEEATAVAAGYRPCAVCRPGGHARWKGPRD